MIVNAGVKMGKYDQYLNGGCGLSDSAIEFLENVRGVPSVSARTDKTGKQRIYVSFPEKVYGAGSNSWIATRSRYIGSSSLSRSANRIQIEAFVVMALGAKNKPSINWLRQSGYIK